MIHPQNNIQQNKLKKKLAIENNYSLIVFALSVGLPCLSACNYVNPNPPEPPVLKTAQQIIEEYDAYWGVVNNMPELGPIGATGWCSKRPIPPEEYEIMKDCSNATPERTVKGATCPN